MSPSATAGRADGLPDAPILRVGILAEVIAKAGPTSLIQRGTLRVQSRRRDQPSTKEW